MCAQPKEIISRASPDLPYLGIVSGVQFSCFSVGILIYPFTFLLALCPKIFLYGLHLPRKPAVFDGARRITAPFTILFAPHAIILRVLKATGRFFIPSARFAQLCVICIALPIFWQISIVLRPYQLCTRAFQFSLLPIIVSVPLSVFYR